MSHVFGIDVSRWQGVCDWEKIAAAGAQFAGIRMSVGDYYTDPYFASNYDAALANGIIPLPYHVNKPKIDPAKQGERIKMSLAARQPKGMVLDCELRDGVHAHDLRDNIYWCLRQLEDFTINKNVMIYTADWFWSEPIGYHALPKDENAAQGYRMRPKEWKLWVASYGANDGQPHPDKLVLPKGWRYEHPEWYDYGWSAWQYTDKGFITGVQGNVDLDFMKESDFADLGGVPQQPPPQPQPGDLEALKQQMEKLEQWARGIDFKG